MTPLLQGPTQRAGTRGRTLSTLRAASPLVSYTQPGETSTNYDSNPLNFTISNFLSVKQQRGAFEANLGGLLFNQTHIGPYGRLTRAAMASHRGDQVLDGAESVGGTGGPQASQASRFEEVVRSPASPG